MTDKADRKALVELAKAVLRDWQMEGGLVTAGTLKLAGEVIGRQDGKRPRLETS